MPSIDGTTHERNKQQVAAIIQSKITAKVLLLSSSSDDFTAQLTTMLGDKFKVESLGGNNNPVAKITYLPGGQIVVLRTVTSHQQYSKESSSLLPSLRSQALDAMSSSPRHEKLFFEQLADISYYADALVVSISIECSDFYAGGNLEQYFDKLRQNTSIEKFSDSLRHFTRNLLFLTATFKRKGVWHTDIKPSNILLNQYQELVLSDTKALIVSSSQTIPCAQVERTPSFYDESVYVDAKKIDLLKLMQQNLAVSVYQMATGTLPLQEQGKLKFNFTYSVFQTNEGKQIMRLIKTLQVGKHFNYQTWLRELANLAWRQYSAQELSNHSFLGLSKYRADTTTEQNWKPATKGGYTAPKEEGLNSYRNNQNKKDDRPRARL